tara:strand:+ start:452 stop:700 length:249 start_codon:yes stop_codon:yes gene_type:complete
MIYREEYIKYLIGKFESLPMSAGTTKMIQQTLEVLKERPHILRDIVLVDGAEGMKRTLGDKYMSYEKFVVYLRDININIILK